MRLDRVSDAQIQTTLEHVNEICLFTVELVSPHDLNINVPWVSKNEIVQLESTFASVTCCATCKNQHLKGVEFLMFLCNMKNSHLHSLLTTLVLHNGL